MIGYLVKVTSTRLFAALPDSVRLSPTGFRRPFPTTTMRTPGSLTAKYAATFLARRSDSVELLTPSEQV